MERPMDRRSRKTREAIFHAFAELLQTHRPEQITVGQIIQRADVGRATFYAHFETRDHLLSELSRELFCHVFDGLLPQHNGHRHIFDCQESGSVFLHLFIHLQRNDNGILQLLSSQNNSVFAGYFKDGLIQLLKSEPEQLQIPEDVPADYWLDHVASSFLQTVSWWYANKMQYTPQQIHGFFLHCL